METRIICDGNSYSFAEWAALEKKRDAPRMKEIEGLVERARQADGDQKLRIMLQAFGLESLCPGRWDSKKFIKALSEARLSAATKLCGSFVLRIYNFTTDWSKASGGKIKQFDAMEALARWDQFNRKVFVLWAKEPFYL